MSGLYIMDACALLALYRSETGADAVNAILNRAYNGEITVQMNGINLLEVYYDIYRELGKEAAREDLAILFSLPIEFQFALTDGVFMEAGRLKASYKISLADSIVLAEALVSGGELITADHHEFDPIEAQETIQFLWIR